MDSVQSQGVPHALQKHHRVDFNVWPFAVPREVIVLISLSCVMFESVPKVTLGMGL